MADANKNSLKYKTPKLKDLLKGSGWEDIPKKVFNQETGESEKGGKKAIDMVLPANETIVLQADAEDTRGLTVKWTDGKGYEIAYWYDTPDNIVPAELKGDGKSFGDIKNVYLGFHPELDEDYKDD